MNALYQSHEFAIIPSGDDYLIETYLPDLNLQNVVNTIVNLQGVTITSFIALRKALASAPSSPMIFGKRLGNILISLMREATEAYISFDLPEEDLLGITRNKLISRIEKELLAQNISFGITLNQLKSTEILENNKKYLVAKGIPPVHGKDAMLSRLNLNNSKIQDYSDMTLRLFNAGTIHVVRKDQWIAEWTIPETGILGTNVFGETIPSIKGCRVIAPFDSDTFTERDDGSKIVLLALKSGAVTLNNKQQLSIIEFLEVDTVDASTGNINFNGSVIVKKSVSEGFSITATNDILIQSSDILSGMNEITSIEGSVSFLCGIKGTQNTKISAGTSIFVKFASDAELIAQENIVAEKCLINCNASSKKVLIQNHSGQIVGGKISADYKIACGILGNDSGKKSVLTVSGFNREKMTEIAEQLKDELIKIRLEIVKFENLLSMADEKTGSNELLNAKIMLLKSYNNKIKSAKEIHEILSTRGNGEIYVKYTVSPGNTIKMGDFTESTLEQLSETWFVLTRNEIIKS